MAYDYLTRNRNNFLSFTNNVDKMRLQNNVYVPAYFALFNSKTVIEITTGDTVSSNNFCLNIYILQI